MATVEYTGDGRVNVRDVGEFTPGDTAEVSGDDAAYLCDERGDFERVGDDQDGDDDEVTSFAFNDGEELTDLTVDEVRDHLDGGEYDTVLGVIEEAEANGENRTGVHNAIESRREG